MKRIVTNDDGTRRTKADVIAAALHALDVDPGMRKVVMIGDRHHDVVGSAQFGIPTIFVTWGYAVNAEADDATWVVQSVDDLRRLIYG